MDCIALTGAAADFHDPCGTGRYLTQATQYFYSLLWDPFVLSRTGAPPALRMPDDPIDPTKDRLLFHAQPTSAADMAAVTEVMTAGGSVVLTQPGPETLARLPAFSRLLQGDRPLVSLKERWDLGPLAERTYHYADRATFLRVNATRAGALSTIGDNPDLVLTGGGGIFAGDPFATIQTYINVAFYPQLLLDFASLLGRLVASLLDRPLSASEHRLLRGIPGLRRDFHAFGFAYMTVLELDRCYGHNHVDVEKAGRHAVEAAGAMTSGAVEPAVRALTDGFRALESENRKLQAAPAVFTDTLHGGGLYNDIGYFEFDWPQHPADVLRAHLSWVRERSYRFNVDFDALSVEHMADRFPRLFDELREAQDEGLVEFVNGTANQPYPPLHSLESQIRQFTDGNAALGRALGRPARIYASQEFGFAPQLASVLSQHGYTGAVLRVQNQGDAPTLRDERILWEAPNGDAVEAVPSHPHKSEQRNDVTYNNVHLKLFAHQQTGLDFAVFTGLGDISYYRPFREELARVCHYAPVFGRFLTWSGYFAEPARGQLARHRFTMEDFDCRAAFMEIEGQWSLHRPVTGGNNTACMRSLSASNLFRAAEMLEAFEAAWRRAGRRRASRGWSWTPLTGHQGHDVYFAPYHSAGSFLGGVSNHHSALEGRAVQNVADYAGPWDFRPVIDRSLEDLARSERAARRSIQRRLRRLVPASPRCDRYVVYNPGPARTAVVTVPRAAEKGLELRGQALPVQPAGRDLLSLVSLPAQGCAMLEATEEARDATAATHAAVTVGDDWLDNGLLRAEFDLTHGTLRRLIGLPDGRDLLAGGSHSFTLPGQDTQRCVKARVAMQGPVRGCLEFEVVIGEKRGSSARIRTRAVLDAQSCVLSFEDRVLRCPEIRGDQWRAHLAAYHTLADASSEMMRSHANVLEPAQVERVFSLNLLLARGADQDVLFINEGNQFYTCRGGQISNILVFEQEWGRAFASGVGFPQDNPIAEARAWVQPTFVAKVGADPGAGPNAARCLPRSFMSVECGDVEVLSVRYDDRALLVRLANTTDAEVQTELNTPLGVREAFLTDLRGANAAQLPVVDNSATVTLRPWDIRQVALAVGPDDDLADES